MTEKLTNLETGTEWKVFSGSFVGEDGARVVTLVPLKPKPPKELWVSFNNSGRVQHLYRTKEESEKVICDGQNPVTRYVLAEDESEKPKREPKEFYAVRVFGGPKSVTLLFDSCIEAIDYQRGITSGSILFRVREVLG